MDIYCRSCGLDLRENPKTNVQGHTYCYRCAKTEVAAREAAQRNAANSEHESAKGVYDREKIAFDETHSEWWGRQIEFLGSGNLGCALATVGAVFGYYMADEIAKGFGFVGVVVIFVLWRQLSGHHQSRRAREFLASNPEPTFEKSAPQRRNEFPVHHSPVYQDGSTSTSTNYREGILRRDNLTCQVCAKKKQRRTLEVHHIIPRSKGGSDEPTNLITLCKYCHDRENWYGHIRKFPTTMKKSRRPYRR